MKGSIRPGRVDGSWYLRVELPHDEKGKRSQQRETVRGTKADALRRLRAMLRELDDGTFTEGGRVKVATLLERWLASAEHRVGARTFQRYGSIKRLYLEPTLGHLRARALRPAHIETALATWISGKRNDHEKGRLSMRSVKHMIDTLKTACRWGVRMDILTRNPVDAVAPPRVDRKEMVALDANGVAALLRAAAGTDLQIPIAVAVGTGLRRGELLGLRWSDIDLKDARLSVRRSVETVDGVTRAKPPKTTRSARTISLAPFVVDALRKHRAQQNERRALLGLGRDVEAWVFDRGDGSVWEPGVFSLHFARLVRRSKEAPRVRFHDLRHSHATLALAGGADLKTISASLGHSTISTTANIYLHVVDSLQKAAADRLDRMLGTAVGDALAAAPVPQRCHKVKRAMKKARGYGLGLVAPTGVEPVSQP